MSKKSPVAGLREIAKNLRSVPDAFRSDAFWSDHLFAIRAGQLLVEAIELGGFGGDEHTVFLHFVAIAKARCKEEAEFYEAVWLNALSLLTPKLRMGDWRLACKQFADLIEAEAKRLERGKTRRKGGKRGPYRTQHDRDEERKLWEDWQSAKRSGTRHVADFAEARGLDEAKVREILERERGRRRRSPQAEDSGQ